MYQPYRPLLPIIQDIGHEDQLLPLTWRIINDSLRTDVSLLYPPYMIAVGCLQLAWYVYDEWSFSIQLTETRVDWRFTFLESSKNRISIQNIAIFFIFHFSFDSFAV